MPYNSGSKKGQLNRCDVKKLYVEKFGESPPTSWNRDKIMVQLEKIKVKKDCDYFAFDHPSLFLNNC